MTPPDWPAGVDYDKAFAVLEREWVRHWNEDHVKQGVAWGGKCCIAAFLAPIAPLIAKAVEEAEADALLERAKATLENYMRLDYRKPFTYFEYRDYWDQARGVNVEIERRALAAHEARKAGR